MVVSSPPKMQAVSVNQHQTMVHRLLAGNATTTPLSSQNRSSAIEDIAHRLSYKQQNGDSHYSEDGIHSNNSPTEEVFVSNNTPSMSLTCGDCGIVKTNFEDMEIHIKTEHLQWLPFQCPICLQDRASDAQMREHLHSAHKKNMNKFIYVDDMAAKRKLQIMMDSAIHASVTRTARANSSPYPSSRESGKEEHYKRISPAHISESPPAEPSPGITATVVPKKRNVSIEIATGDTNTDALLASISRATNCGSEPLTEDSLANMFFGNYKNLKTDTDGAFEHDEGVENENEDSVLDNIVNPIAVLDDVAALFSNTTDNRIEDSFTSTHDRKPITAKIVSNQVSKKRVLGECSKCNKPVTAGARQMHMFYHLAKDHKTYRFRCLFDNCTIEHYRKDQMENHQSKVHGKIDLDMMEDRSLELFSRCQELNHELFVANRSMITHMQSQDLSMELLGTKSGATPGPTAAKAELSYQAQNNKDKKVSKDSVTPRMVPDEEHPLECQLCHKTMQNRIRGFHILWHLAKDMGIMRYICKICGFAHDRSQSVQTHGKKEHGADDVVLDKIKEYDAEVNMMSKKCFGFVSSFSQDNKRRSKIPVIIPTSSSNISKKRKLDLEEGSEQNVPSDSDEVKIEDESPDEQDDASLDHDAEEDEESKPVRKRKAIRSARFGTRRPASKSKRVEMLRLREISMLIGGAQYYKKKSSETAVCETCGKFTNSRLTEHAYTHLKELLFSCPLCDFGSQARDSVLKHCSERHHGSDAKPVDNRLKYAKEIKEAVRTCYSIFFVDAPIPTVADIEKLQQGTDHIAGVAEGHESDEAGEEEVPEAKWDGKEELDDDEREGGLEMEEEEDEQEDEEEVVE